MFSNNHRIPRKTKKKFKKEISNLLNCIPSISTYPKKVPSPKITIQSLENVKRNITVSETYKLALLDEYFGVLPIPTFPYKVKAV